LKYVRDLAANIFVQGIC